MDDYNHCTNTMTCKINKNPEESRFKYIYTYTCIPI